MPPTVEQLQEKLAETRNPLDRIDIMLDLCRAMIGTDPSGARSVAARAARAAATRKDPNRHARALAATAQAAIFEGDTESVDALLARALESAERGGDVRARVMVRAVIRDHCLNRGELVKAMEYAHQVLDLAEPANLIEPLANCQNVIGAIYTVLGDYPMALEHLNRAVEYFEQTDSDGGAIVVGNIGGIYCNLGECAKAEEVLLRSIEMARAMNNRRAEMLNLGMFGFNALELNKIDDGLAALLHALSASRDYGLHLDEVELLRGVAVAHMYKGQLESALTFAREGYDAAVAIGHNRRPAILGLVGQILMKLGRYEESRAALLEALEQAQTIGNESTVGYTHQLLSECLELMGNSAGSLAHYKAYIQSYNEVAGHEQQRKVTQLEMRQEIERAAAERARLREEAEKLAYEMERMQREMTAMSLQLVEKNEFLDTLKREMKGVMDSVDDTVRPSLKGLVRAVEGNLASEEGWRTFREQFELVHRGYLDRLARTYPRLTRTELKVCALLKLQMSTKEIARVMSVAPKTVEIHRYRIRRKLGLSVDQSFSRVLADV